MANFKVVQIADVFGVFNHMKEALKDKAVDCELKICYSEDQVIAAATDADVLVTMVAYQAVTKRVMEALPKLRYILNLISGVDAIDMAAANERGILVTNMPEYFDQEVSDHAMALVLACSRQVVALHRLVNRGEWYKNPIGSRVDREVWPKLSRLQNQTLGLVGFGRIARSLVPKAKGFGLRLVSYDPYLPPKVFQDLGVERVELDALLKQSDFVCILIPLSNETRGMIGAAELRKMKPTAHLINTSRGPIVNSEALFNALNEGVIAGAGLDVVDPEPSSPENNPVLRLDNVIITGHNAGVSRNAFGNLAPVVPQQILKVMNGEWPIYLVNPDVKDKYLQKWGKRP